MRHVYCRFDNHVINIHLHISSNLIIEQPFDQALVCSSCIFQLERHHLVRVDAITGIKCCFLLIIRVHLDLVVHCVSIRETKQIMYNNCVH